MRVAVVGSGPAGFYAAGPPARERGAGGRGRPDRAAADARGGSSGSASRPTTRTSRRSRARSRRSPRGRASASSATSRSAATCRTRSSLEHYDAVVYAVGAQTDRRLGIPGEDLPGSWAATEFVAWYNGHPDFQELDVRPVRRAGGRDRERQRRARRRADAGADAGGARPTDTTDPAIEAIVAAGIREILVLGRRGPVQAAWTPVEVGELGELAGADIAVDPAELELDADQRRRARGGRTDGAPQPRPPPRLRGPRAGGQADARSGSASAPRRSRSSATDRVEGDRGRRATSSSPAPTGASGPWRPASRELVPCGIVFRSVGYHGVPVPGLPFDERRGTIANSDGRVARRGRRAAGGRLLHGLDQARPERRDRHEQEGRDRDGRAAARGRARGRSCPDGRRTSGSTSCWRSGASSPSSTRAGRRSTRPSAPPASRRAGRA